ncbi:hypothetical protein [Actinoplanes awajinensis]|uniref:Secreted protein n=1 Tax=Actinoplanes awajinensis subsp. mycoplanecinus TaxID=135947 RepID=A0A0X3V3Z8_9ACTN|nr:hypothetical protein [Actinoplanes awajinensis]KUL39509.1 hypothetical protein ADL15_09630 [Actinoplanes awajinensis subsp. mycoplanecinus]
MSYPRFGAALLVAGLALSGLATVGATPAAAATLPFGTVRAVVSQSTPDAQPKKSFSTFCNPGERVTGGGAFTVGGVHAVITEMQPIQNLTARDSFRVTAEADQFGIAGNWSFQVFAFCATPPASAAIEIVKHVNPARTGGTDQAFAPCPAGKLLIGTGGKIDNAGGQMDLGMFPNSSGTLATGSAAFAKPDADGYSGAYTVTGYSVCAKPNSLLDDFKQQRVSFLSPAGTTSQKQVPAACPSGSALSGLAGATVLPGTHLQQIRPNSAGRPANLATFGAQATIVPSEAWQMDTTMFCVR